MSPAERGPVGTRLALVGAVLYLSEWVVIFAAATEGPFGPREDAGTVAARYADTAGGAAVSAAFFAVLLLGRVLFMAGLKASLRRHPEQLGLMDVAVVTMALSVVLEIGSYAVAAAAARLASTGGDETLVGALDSTASWLNMMLFGPAAVSMVAAGVAMLRSQAFSQWLCWVPLGAGVAGIAAALVVGASGEDWGTVVVDAATTVAVLGMWVWMIATGIVLVRARRTRRYPPVPDRVAVE